MVAVLADTQIRVLGRHDGRTIWGATNIKQWEEMMSGEWEPMFSSSGRGTWYVDNVRYPSGAAGCVGKGFGGGWVVACQPCLGSFSSRDAAARAERDFIKALDS